MEFQIVEIRITEFCTAELLNNKSPVYKDFEDRGDFFSVFEKPVYRACFLSMFGRMVSVCCL